MYIILALNYERVLCSSLFLRRKVLKLRKNEKTRENKSWNEKLLNLLENSNGYEVAL